MFLGLEIGVWLLGPKKTQTKQDQEQDHLHHVILGVFCYGQD